MTSASAGGVKRKVSGATIAGKTAEAAHTVTNLTIRVEPVGKVWGTSTESG